MSEALYSTPILRLAATIPHIGLIDGVRFRVQKTSRICGSRLTVSVDLDASGRVTAFGQEVKACALGQASASLMGQQVLGLDRASFEAAEAAMRAMIAGEAYHFPAGFAEFAILEPVKDHKARHGSVMLPFECLAEVFSQR